MQNHKINEIEVPVYDETGAVEKTIKIIFIPKEQDFIEEEDI